MRNRTFCIRLIKQINDSEKLYIEKCHLEIEIKFRLSREMKR